MNKMTKLLAGLLLLAALLIGAYALMLARQPRPEPTPVAPAAAVPANQYAVVVASQPLQAGKPIAADAVRVEKLPLKPGRSFENAAEVVGQIPVTDIDVGVPLLQTHLSGGLASQVGEGERAVAINIDEAIGVGYRVKPGDFVDVFVVFKQDSNEITPSQSRLLLSRLRVLAAGASSVNEDAAKTDSATRGPARTAVLAVPIDDINTLNLAQNAGRLTLALRNPKDEAVPSASLFPALPPVLHARSFKPGSTDAVSGKVLSQALMGEPVNQAFAGTSLSGLSSRRDSPVSRPGVVHVGRPAPVIDGVEIIRGGVRQ